MKYKSNIEVCKQIHTGELYENYCNEIRQV